MSAATAATDWIHVVAHCAGQAAEVAVAAGATAADLVGPLADHFDTGSAGQWHEGVSLQVAGGAPIPWEGSLAAHGISHGAHIFVAPKPAPPPRHDDVVVALAASPDGRQDPARQRRMVAVAAAVLILVGSGTLLLGGADAVGAAVAGVVTLVLVAGVVAIHRAPEAAPPVAPVHGVAALAVVTGGTGALVQPWVAVPGGWAGTTALALAASAALCGPVPALRCVAWAVGIMAGVLCVATGLVSGLGWEAPRAALVLMPAAVLFAEGVRWRVPRGHQEGNGVWRHWLQPSRDMAGLRNLWVGGAAARALLLVTGAWVLCLDARVPWGALPDAGQSGGWGVLAAVTAALAVLLAERHVAAAQVQAWNLVGVVGVVSAACWSAASGAPQVAWAVLASAVGLTVGDLSERWRPELTERVLDLGHGALLLALVPLLVMASTLPGRVGFGAG